MATDDERRRVAERLRGSLERLDGNDFDCHFAEAVFGPNFCDAPCEECHVRVTVALADLIDPPAKLYDSPDSSNSGADVGREIVVDREALLALEREMRLKAKESEAYFAGIHPGEVIEYADRISKACGEAEA